MGNHQSPYPPPARILAFIDSNATLLADALCLECSLDSHESCSFAIGKCANYIIFRLLIVRECKIQQTNKGTAARIHSQFRCCSTFILCVTRNTLNYSLNLCLWEVSENRAVWLWEQCLPMGDTCPNGFWMFHLLPHPFTTSLSTKLLKLCLNFPQVCACEKNNRSVECMNIDISIQSNHHWKRFEFEWNHWNTTKQCRTVIRWLHVGQGGRSGWPSPSRLGNGNMNQNYWNRVCVYLECSGSGHCQPYG